MAEKTLHVVVLLDRSGSMQARKADHEGGLRSFIEDQKSVDGDVRFTLIQFDDANPCEVVYDDVPITDVGTVELVPRGGTPLLDAIFKSIAHVEKKIGTDTNVVFMIITDGEENQSREATKQGVQSAIKEHEAKGWVVLYLGANVDCFAQAQQLGTSAVRSAGFANSAQAAMAVYDDIKGKVWMARSESQTSGKLCSANYCYTDDDRARLMAGDVNAVHQVNSIVKTGSTSNPQNQGA